MKLVDGRTNAFITLPGGRRVYSGVFLSLAMYAPGVAECMIRQDARGGITVHLVPEVPTDAGYTAAARAFGARFHDLVGVPVELRFVRTDRIELTAGGKGRFVESEFTPPAARAAGG
jgi:phenylacetate-CoA ligase